MNKIERNVKPFMLPNILGELQTLEAGHIEVTGTGEIRIVNTGGSSAGEGGMGSGHKEDTSKGDLTKAGEKSGTTATEEDNGFDPIGKGIKEKEKLQDKE
ncbi:MAG: hypothetical protein JWQ96_2853 [Segetibacter sp.]|nr:hypothetical protein [Segetibacter sp.]